MISHAQVRRQLPFRGVAARYVLVCFLVFATYNPSNYSLFVWLLSGHAPTSVKMFAAASAAILWVVLLRIAFSGLRGFGFFALALLAIIVALLEWEYQLLANLSRFTLFFLLQLAVATAISFGLLLSYWVRQSAGQSPVVKHPP